MKNIVSTSFISKVESERFNMNILRAKSENIELKNLQSKILNVSADIVFLRIPSENVSQIQNLSKLGYEYFQADTLVYYSVEFNNYTPKPIKNTDLIFVKATRKDKDLLKKMVNDIFIGYTNHYYSNPYIDKTDILEGYAEWVANFIESENEEVFIVYRNQEPIAFATCSEEDGIAEGVLYGVKPSSSGGGVYSDIIRYTQNYYLNKGVKKMKVSTQVQNYAVQKVWSREGFFMNESFATVHINPFLNYSKLPLKEFQFTVTEDLIEDYANISGDHNAIHFDDEKAKECGFTSKIAHGLLACGEISRILGTDFPGAGTIFMNYKNIFLAPFYPNQDYKFILSTPFANEKGIYLCIVKVYDSKQNLVMISYNQLIKKI